MRIFRVRRAGRNAQAVLPVVAALFRDDIADVRVLVDELRDVAVPLHHQVHLARGEQVLPVVLKNALDIFFVFNQLGGGLADLLAVGGVERVAEVAQRHADHGARLADPADAAGMLVGLPAPHRRPRVGRARHFGLAVADSHGAPHVGHGEFAARVKLGVAESPVDIFAEVRDLAVVQRLQQFRAPHAFNEIVGRHDDVVAGISLAHFGEEFGVVAEQIHLHFNAAVFAKIRERGFTDVGVPVVEVEFFLLLAEHGRRQRKTRGGRAGGGEEISSGEFHWGFLRIIGGEILPAFRAAVNRRKTRGKTGFHRIFSGCPSRLIPHNPG